MFLRKTIRFIAFNPAVQRQTRLLAGIRTGHANYGIIHQSKSEISLPKCNLQLHKFFSSDSTAKCWNCDHNLSTKLALFCPSCNNLQKANNDLTFFEIFELPGDYTINPTELTKKFRTLQSFLHPDKFSQKTKTEKENSEEWSSLVNKAYKTLTVPLTRAEYILKLEGIPLPEDNSALDAEFLMEMMERNEEIEAASEKEELKELLEKVQEDKNDLVKILESAISSKHYEDAVKVLIRMRYTYSIENSIKLKVQKLGISLD